MPHSQPTALQQTVCKFHLDPQYHIFHWGSTILGDSTLCVNSVALAQASNFGIKRRQVVFLCWITIFMLVCQLYHLPFKRHFISDKQNLCTDIWLTFSFFSVALDHSSWTSLTIPGPWKKPTRISLSSPWHMTTLLCIHLICLCGCNYLSMS